MSMRIIQPDEIYRIDQLVGCIYGAPGLLKTSLAFTAEAPILLDFDLGVHRAAFRRAFVPCESWEAVAAMEKSDFEGYKTVIVDTAGRAIDALGRDIIRRDAKMGNASGGLSLQGFGRLKSEFPAWLKKLKSFGLDIVLIAHMEETRNGDETIERIDAQGASKQEIYKSADFMGRVLIGRDNGMVLNLSPTDAAFGKNPGNLQPVTFKMIDGSSTILAQVIQKTKDRINAMTEEQRAVSGALEAWRVLVADAVGMETPAALTSLTALVSDVVGLDHRIQDNAKRVLNSLAKDAGYVWDKEKAAFVVKPTPEGGEVKSEASTPAQNASPASTGGAGGDLFGGTGEAAAKKENGPKEAKETKKGAAAAKATKKDPAEPAVDPPAKSGPGEKATALEGIFAAKYPDADARKAAFQALDARTFFKGKTDGARESALHLSEIDAGILLGEIEQGVKY